MELKTTNIRKSHFSAAHRLHNHRWSDHKNRDIFESYNNPNYHGQNYDLEVKVIRLSKLNRIVQYFAKRPQAQERLANQIAVELQCILETNDVAVIIDAKYLCVSSRGVQDINSSTITAFYGGIFMDSAVKKELWQYLKM